MHFAGVREPTLLATVVISDIMNADDLEVGKVPIDTVKGTRQLDLQFIEVGFTKRIVFVSVPVAYHPAVPAIQKVGFVFENVELHVYGTHSFQINDDGFISGLVYVHYLDVINGSANYVHVFDRRLDAQGRHAVRRPAI
jgi:hypothetical protein